MSKKTVRHMWTKKEIGTILDLWDSCTIDEIAKKLGLRKEQITYMANAIRKVSPKAISKKHNVGYLRNLILDVLD